MKLTAAFVAAALAASKVHGLPIADSGTSIVVARSDVKLDGGATLQAARRGTDTELIPRQLHRDGEALQIMLARNTGSLQDNTIAQRDFLAKRTPVNVIDEANHLGEVVSDLTIAGPSHSTGLSDIGSLKLTDSAGAESSTSASDQLVKSPSRGTGGQPTESTKVIMKQLEHQRQVDWNALAALQRASWMKPNDKDITSAVMQHASHFHVNDHEYMLRLPGWKYEPSPDDVASLAFARDNIEKTKIKPTNTPEELLEHKARESATHEALKDWPQERVASGRQAHQEALDALSQAKARWDHVNEHLPPAN